MEALRKERLQDLGLLGEALENTTFLGTQKKKKNAKSWLQLSVLSYIFQGHLQERTWSEPSERPDGSMGDQKGKDNGGAVRKVRAGRTRKFSPMPLFLQVGKLRSREEQGPAQGQE